MAAARVLVPHLGAGGRTIAFVDPFHDAAALASDSSLIAMCGATSLPLDLSPDGPLLALVPEADREWATAGSVALMARLWARDGSIAAVVLLSARRCGRRFGRRDRWFVSALAAGAAAAWAALGPDDAGDTGSGHVRDFATAGEAAFECDRCGLIMEPMLPACRCGGRAALASLPQTVAETFIVVRRIGAGGMGVVCLARDTVLDREVALKTLPTLEDAAAVRLHDEARAMAALNHESLATIYGLEFWRRTPILVVEYFPEGTLARRLACGPLPPEAALVLGVRLARALSYMHGTAISSRATSDSRQPGFPSFWISGWRRCRRAQSAPAFPWTMT